MLLFACLALLVQPAKAGFDEATVFMAILPLGHNYNLASPGMLATLLYGGTVVLAAGTNTISVGSIQIGGRNHVHARECLERRSSPHLLKAADLLGEPKRSLRHRPPCPDI